MFRLSSLRTSPLLVLAVLLAATLVARPGRALPTGLGVLAPEIETLYNAGSYSSAAGSLQAAIAQNPKGASLYYWMIIGWAVVTLRSATLTARLRTGSVLSLWIQTDPRITTGSAQ
jgi:hypothetical protein